MKPAATLKAASSSAAIGRLQADQDQRAGEQFEQAGRPGDQCRGGKTQPFEIGRSAGDIAEGGETGPQEQEGQQQSCCEKSGIGSHE